MKNRLLIILLIIGIMSTWIYNFYQQQNFEKRVFMGGQAMRLFKANIAAQDREAFLRQVVLTLNKSMRSKVTPSIARADSDCTSLVADVNNSLYQASHAQMYTEMFGGDTFDSELEDSSEAYVNGILQLAINGCLSY